jgi:hypothetical protein
VYLLGLELTRLKAGFEALLEVKEAGSLWLL